MERVSNHNEGYSNDLHIGNKCKNPLYIIWGYLK